VAVRGPASRSEANRYRKAAAATAAAKTTALPSNRDDALRACTRVEQAAADCGIGEIEWQDNRHDFASLLTLPLGRGLAATKWTRAK